MHATICVLDAISKQVYICCFFKGLCFSVSPALFSDWKSSFMKLMNSCAPVINAEEILIEAITIMGEKQNKLVIIVLMIFDNESLLMGQKHESLLMIMVYTQASLLTKGAQPC